MSTNERVTNKFLLFLFQVRNHPRQTRRSAKNSVIQCLEQGIYVFDLEVSHLINDRAVYHIVTLFMTPALRKVGEKRATKTELLVEIILFYHQLDHAGDNLGNHVFNEIEYFSCSAFLESEKIEVIVIITFLSHNWRI